LSQLIIGLILSIIIALTARYRRALTNGGVAAAILLGTIIFGFGGWTWGVVLVSFFALSSVLSRYRLADKRELADKFHGATLHRFWPTEAWRPWCLCCTTPTQRRR
jgi:uncharacterized membrane protein